MRVETSLIQQTTGVSHTKNGFGTDVRAWGRLFQRKYRDRTLVGVLMMVFQRKFSATSQIFLSFTSMMAYTEWSGINALLYYGPTLVQSIGLQGNTVTLLVSGGIGIVQFIAAFPAIIYIDQWGESIRFSAPQSPLLNMICNVGRKPLLRGTAFPEFYCSPSNTDLVGGSAIMTCSHFVIALLVRISADLPLNPLP